jgi:hypothetical protein
LISFIFSFHHFTAEPLDFESWVFCLIKSYQLIGVFKRNTNFWSHDTNFVSYVKIVWYYKNWNTSICAARHKNSVGRHNFCVSCKQALYTCEIRSHYQGDYMCLRKKSTKM